ncbi:MAG: hypothetical protein K2O06_15465 [Acetatifactor sp.]|nr:hypothetical protein [Acetatifactor sp.]
MKKFELEIIDQAVKALGNLPDAIRIMNEVLDEEIFLPNTPFPVAVNMFYWDTIRECNGWRLQQNEFTRHCRLVDSENIRRAWGTKNAMVKALWDINNRISTL